MRFLDSYYIPLADKGNFLGAMSSFIGFIAIVTLGRDLHEYERDKSSNMSWSNTETLANN